MKRFPLVALALALGALLTPMLAQNRNVATRLGFVDADALVQAHPDYKKVQDLQAQARKELAPLEEKLKPLDQKIRSGQATAKERQDYEALLKTYQDTLKKWQDRQNPVLRPILEEVDQAIAKVAKAQGFAVVMSRQVAAQSGLVVYAGEDTDLTQAVIKELKK
ncbi:MAG TPA: OmpH family outer membrane protein [Thermus scotoductus]|jgi:outer membrane protein|uniref:OmpH family outer membrane protein n=1 Tax=Thermus scotoductus TaxID=37636 RepID=UPI0003768018|nr:OmpH family outer membrane protein [Thermus scotoductus]HAR68291.1 OmpH family outer membrane protein [Thermus scotoductus]